jgi:hypothetical protein
MALSRIWIGHLFVTQVLPVTEARRKQLDLRSTVIERRQDLLIRAVLRDRPFFRAQKTKFDEITVWEKSALMIGASCLPKSEFKVWLDNIKANFSDPFGDIYVKWLTSNQERLIDFLKEDYVIKSRVEKMIEVFTSLVDEAEAK